MDENNQEPESQGSNPAEYVTMLFKHKWKLLLCGAVGLIAGAILYLSADPIYESSAKLFVQYVDDEPNVGIGRQVSPPQSTLDAVMDVEVEILKSLDLIAGLFGIQPKAGNAPQEPPRPPIVSPERLFGSSYSSADSNTAIRAVARSLTVTNTRGSKVIHISYTHTDPIVSRDVLRGLIDLYLDKHAKMHRPPGEAIHILDQQTSMARAELDRIEAELSKLKGEADFTIAETAEMLNTQYNTAQQGLQRAKLELIDQKTRLAEIERLVGSSAPATEPESAAKLEPNTLIRYRSIVEEITQVRQFEGTLGLKYATGSDMMKGVRERREKLENERATMENEFPVLLAEVPAQSGIQGSRPDVILERARFKAIEEKVQLFEAALQSVRQQQEKFGKIAPKIASLDRERGFAEKNYKDLKEQSDKARLRDMSTPLTAPNISIVQEPVLSTVKADAKRKIGMGLAAGGFLFGVALIFLIETLLNRTVKRPLEIESKIGIPLWQSIPQVKGRALRSASRKELADRKADTQLASWDAGHFIRPFAESIRDRLVLYFEQNGLTRKPKLVGVTGWAEGAGTSTLASGLAAALSETGDGKVLLVDMNLRNAEMHRFFDGRPASQIVDALKGAEKLESAAENLYIATATQNDAGTALMFPKRFYDLMPRLQASDFDYIIFDMPPMKDSNVTLAMAGFMDKLLMVVEADKNNIVPLKRACSELVSAKAKVAGVLNKLRIYGPGWLQPEGC